MQTRKRAKSVSFGKPAKEKKDEEVIEKTHEKHTVEKVDAKESITSKESIDEKPVEKAEVVERRPVAEKPQVDTLSPESEDENKEETSENEAVPETSPQIPSGQSELSSSPVATTLNQTVAPVSEPPPPVVTPTQEPIPAVTSQPTASQDLSPTLPQSAFTIQNNESDIPAEPEKEKKKFGVYFFVVAFLSFILGLGAMAAVSYFGLISLSIPKLSFSSGMHLPSLLGAKPTLTPMPTPTATPTPVPVNLKQFSIEVLNGSGITGQAAKAQSALTTDGYSVSSTGNAANSNFTTTEIAAKKSVDSAYITKLEQDLGKTYVVNTTIQTLSDTNTTDVTVTLGSQTAK